MLKSETYSLWFAPLRFLDMDGDVMRLEVRDEFCEVWLRDNYLGLLRSVVSRAAVRPMEIEFQVAPPNLEGDGAKSETKEAGEAGVENREPWAATSGSGAGLLVTERVSVGSLQGKNPKAEVREQKAAPIDEIFNPENTFETFVVGSNNEFAHSAAMAVAKNPGRAYNPLFIFGGVGLGKTHLLQAIGHHVQGTRKNARIGYLSCEKFTNDYIDAMQNNLLVKFRRRYRQLDLLLVDDIQFLGGKERIQEEFFHTFNTLHESRKQIVLSCDRPANEIKGLEDRLTSRFEWGQTVDLQAPDVETRTAILRKKARLHGFDVPPEIVEFIATRIRTNVRRLEGAFIRVASYTQLTGRPLTMEVVENLLGEILDEEGAQTVTVELIQRRVAEHFDIRMADMTSKRRPECIAFPRQVAMYLARRLTGLSLNAIGDEFGGRDHGTVLHACRQVKCRMELDVGVRQKVAFLERQLSR